VIDHTDNDLSAAAKALRDVVAPALGTGNTLANQQLKLVIDWLEFYQTRLHLIHDRQALELSNQLQTAERVASAMPSNKTASIQSAIDEGKATFAALEVQPARLRAAIGRLEETISGAVQRASEYDPSQRRIIERAVIEDTRQLLDAQRAWFLPLSVEAAPEQVPELRKALGIDK
jgi:hypothetical protein